GGQHPELEASPMIGPGPPVAPLGGEQGAGVVDQPHAGWAPTVATTSPTTRPRAADSSASDKAPWSASHSKMARRPSATSNARRAAAVIQAETLIPSSAAAASTRSWTAGSTVMASLGDGFPRGMAKLYYHSR